MKRRTILSHNAFWFQGAPFPDDVPSEPVGEIVRRLTALYKEVEPSIVCLQEIQSLETFESVSRQLKYRGSFCAGLQLPQYGAGVFWATDRCRPYSNSRNSASQVQRVWQTCEVFLGDTLLRISNVHLPSGRQLGPEKAAEKRIAELTDAIHCCRSGPDIIAGDFNEWPGYAVSEYLSKNGYVDAAVVMNAEDRPTNLGGKRIDYFWVKKDLEKSLRHYDVVAKEKCTYSRNGKKFLSDHLPLWIVLEIE